MPSPYNGLPLEIQVGPYAVRIEIKDEVGEGKNWGEYDGGRRSINLARDQACNGAALAVTLHEMLHAIWHLAGLASRYEEKQEEEIVDVLSTWLTMVYKTNPELMKWIASASKK